MSTPARLGAFVAALAVVFAGAFGVGSALGSDDPTETIETGTAAALSGTEGSGAGDRGDFRLVAAATSFQPAESAAFEFRIDGPEGQPLTSYDTNHERDLHLIVVRDDLGSYQHVHPEIDDAGTWTVPLDLSSPGRYRAIADFTPTSRGEAMTLDVDLTVAGDPPVAPPFEVSRTASVDGYEIEMTGEPSAGDESTLTFTVRRDGEPVDELQPYLGADGHLVALRTSDLDYLHTHPLGASSDGAVSFGTTLPAAGEYRLYFEFRHDDAVHIAPFAISASPAASSPTTADATGADDATSTTEVHHGHDDH